MVQLVGPANPVAPHRVKSADDWNGPIKFEYATDLVPAALVAVTAAKTKRASAKTFAAYVVPVSPTTGRQASSWLAVAQENH